MRLVRTCAAAAAFALSGCVVALDLDQGPILSDLFGDDPHEVSADALAGLPERFVMLASEEASADAAMICSWLIARLERSCDVVRSEGDRLDFQRAAATPGMLIIGSAEAARDFPRFRPLRWRDVNGYLLITRRLDGALSEAALRGRRIAAGDSAQTVAESLIAAAALRESDFDVLIGLGDLRSRPRRLALTKALCDREFDVIIAPSGWATAAASISEQDDTPACALDLVQIQEATLTRLLDARSDLDRRDVEDRLLAALGMAGGRYEMVVHARNLLYARLFTPAAEDALRRALTLPLENRWRDAGVQRHRDRRLGASDD